MEIYQVNGEWFAKARGGFCNRDTVPATEVGPFPARPEPLAAWKKTDESRDGCADTDYTVFGVNGVPAFMLVNYGWSGNFGNAWEEVWEEVSMDLAQPPKLGPAYRWTGEGWEEVSHPMAVR